MEREDFINLIKELTSLKEEIEWVEFKHNNSKPQDYWRISFSFINSVCLFHKKYAYLVYGIEDETHKILGTKFRAKSEKIGNQPIENWLATQLEPKINFEIIEDYYDDKLITIFKIESAKYRPIRFKGTAYIRINSCKKNLTDHPEKERKLWQITSKTSFDEDIALEKVTEDIIFEYLDYPSYFNLMKKRLPDIVTRQSLSNKKDF